MPGFFVDADISKAKTLSKDFYIQQRFFEEAKQKIFSNTCHFVGNTDLVKEQGACHPFSLLQHYLDEPLLLTKDKNNDLHCLSNVCTHREIYWCTNPAKGATSVVNITDGFFS
jgi:choline monooxygenase